MAENPLLPHRKLREMYALMERCRGLDRKYTRQQKARGAIGGRAIAREALLAATSMHLVPGDLLCAAPGDRAAQQLAPAAKKAGISEGNVIAAPDLSPRFVLCAALARGMQAAAAEGIVLAYADAGAASHDNAGWPAALEWAQTAQLPLLLACADSGHTSRRSGRPKSKSAEPPLDLTSMNRLAQRLRLPVIPVDGEDAVAIYRVMQESALRARMGGGPAVIWAMMTPITGSGGLPRAGQPIPRLRNYMAARRISLN